jgi:hypothetical protein
MSSTLLLDQISWDLVLDAAGNIAVASEPYSLSQDAASAIMTYQGEAFWDTTLGVPYLTQIFGHSPTIEQLKSLFTAAALTVPDVVSAKCFIALASDRAVSGQIQVTSASTGVVSAASFTVINPMGGVG